MRKGILLVLILAAVAAPSFAGTKACTAGMVTSGICTSPTNVVLYFDAPAAFWTSMGQQICATQGYQATVSCTNEPGCVNGQMPNPQTCGQFAQKWIKQVFITIEKSGRAVAAGNVARDAVLAEPDPNVAGD